MSIENDNNIPTQLTTSLPPPDGEGWKSFWDIASPETAALRIIDLYGALADRAISECAAVACADDRDEDYRFWLQVQGRITAIQQSRREAAIEHWNAIGLATI